VAADPSPDDYFDEKPPSRLADAVETALDRAADHDYDGAKAVLDEHTTECLADVPTAEPVDDAAHVSACHLDVDGREPAGD
jgi:hypothetical protein